MIPARCVLEVDLHAIEENIRILKAHAGSARLMGVLKANAYGLGATKVLPAFVSAGIDAIGVTTAREAEEVRRLFAGDIHLLGAFLPEEIPHLIAADVIFPVGSMEALDLLAEAGRVAQENDNGPGSRRHDGSRKDSHDGNSNGSNNDSGNNSGNGSGSSKDNCLPIKKPLRAHLVVDTGMGRLGALPHEAEEIIKKAHTLKEIDLCGMYSHFPQASIPNDPYTQAQIKSFSDLIHKFRSLTDIPPPKDIPSPKDPQTPTPPAPSKNPLTFHIANSDGIHHYSEASLDMVRSGIHLYGGYLLAESTKYQLQSVVSFRSHIVALRKLPAGSHIGYGCTYRLEAPRWIATVAAGYADGVPFALGEKGCSGHVIISGNRDPARYPIVGRVSMDYLTVDVGDASRPPAVRNGDNVILIGRAGDVEVTVEDWANLKGTHPYDILTSISPRVQRMYVNPPTK